jgi:hypothetical protein
LNLDQFFTPAEACALAYRTWEGTDETLRIGDFSCGDGALLELSPFPNKRVFGLDIDPHVISKLRERHSDWNLCVGDFLVPSNDTALFLENLVGTLDVVVLNPPFSCRGGAKQKIIFNDQEVFCSKSIAFLVKSLTFLKENGTLMAILPKSVLHSEKDALAMNMIRSRWHVDIKEEFSRKTFQGCFPQSICVCLRRRIERTLTVPSSIMQSQKTAQKLTLVRGCISIHSTSNIGSYKVLHTTELRKNEPLLSISRYSSRIGRAVTGKIVTLPRVGVPDKEKVRLLDIKESVSLSDCVLALVPEDASKSIQLLENIKDNWELFETYYGSTCAPYITLSQVIALLSKFGWESLIMRDKMLLDSMGNLVADTSTRLDHVCPSGRG